MQDNRLQKEKDPAFEDKAWMDMRRLLDKEMPVQKKERSILWWWGSAGILILLVLLGSLFVFLNKKQASTYNRNNIAVNEHASVSTQEEQQVATSKKGVTKNTETEKQKIISIDQTKNPVQEQTKSLKTSERKETPNKNNQNKNLTNKILKGTAHSTALDNRIYPNVIIADDALNLQNSIIIPRKALEEITHSSLGSPTFNQEEKIPLVEKKELLTIQHMPSLEIMSLPIVSYQATFPVQAIPKKPRMDWALVASLGTFKLTRFNEYAIGLKTTYQWHPKWRIGTGLHYHYFRFNGLVKADNNANIFSVPEPDRSMDSMDITADAPANTAGAGTSINEEQQEDVATSEIEQFFVDPLAISGNGHYLSMPLLVEYEISSRVKIDVGAAYYYQLTTSYNSVENRLKPSDWTTFLGMGYELTPYVDLRFSYERNWSKQRSNSVSTDFINVNTLDDAFSDRAAISPLESRFKISGIWRF